MTSRFASGTAIVIYLALLRMALYAVAGPNYGYFRDELYYLACGEHPAWGYVDQPPLVAWVAWLLQHTIGTSLWAIRLLPALAGASTIVLTGRLTRAFGGRRWAMFVAALSALLAPIALAFSHLFTMNAFDPLLWTGLAYLLVRLIQSGNERLWISIGALVGLAILNKYAIVFWLSGLALGILLTPLRRSLRQRWFWLGTALATVIALPNFLWQWTNQFPFLELMRNVRSNGRDVALPMGPYLAAQAEMLGYVAVVLVLGAILFFISKNGQRFRVLGFAYVTFLAEMLVLHGKMYYLAPVYPMLFAAGAVWLEAASERSWTWIRPALAWAIFIVSAIHVPTIFPLLNVPTLLAYQQTLGITQQRFENQRQGVLPQLYADMFGWQEMAQTVGTYFATLTQEEQRTTAIFANNYGEAGAIDFFGPRYSLPKSIGNHQNYWLWGPRAYTGASIIVMGDGDERNMQTKCASYSTIGTTKHPLSRPDEWIPIYHCRGFKGDLRQLWPDMKRWN
jgi:4-amino-4-deoxy-L-arabinose transferase-like glycosyltransferase